ncbi:lysophospholipid acyltransferase family protein [Zavarzinia sp. CC-PAN008]|uniref:lysophospholipid acyltransferase family protein n=1 Tax=Zavarzinia sp. CC-PAN008 TaxID=3243332 RepID=UPI003F748A69
MIWLRSIAFAVAFYGWTVLVCVAAIPTLALPTAWSLRAQRLWAWGTATLLRVLCGIRLEVRGAVPSGPVLVAAKHQSAFDTIVLHALLPHPAIVLKRELLWIPVYGWFGRRWNMIPVDRAAAAAALRQMVRRAQEEVANGRPILIFPEGTRTPPGAPPSYNPGVAALYGRLGVPCVPVALNTGVFWPRRAWLRRPGTMVVAFLEPIAPGLGRAQFMQALEQRIEDASTALLPPR